MLVSISFVSLTLSLDLFVICVGFCSNGEHNVLRSQGYTRPLSILKIRSTVRSKYAKMSKSRMIKMLSSEGLVLQTLMHSLLTVPIPFYILNSLH